MDKAHVICNLKFHAPSEHNSLKHHYNFIIKQLVNEFKENLIVLGKMQKSTKQFLFQ